MTCKELTIAGGLTFAGSLCWSLWLALVDVAGIAPDWALIPTLMLAGVALYTAGADPDRTDDDRTDDDLTEWDQEGSG